MKSRGRRGNRGTGRRPKWPERVEGEEHVQDEAEREVGVRPRGLW